jgi:pilus assembly protein Flp/PilA
MTDYFLKGLSALRADRRGVTAMEYAVIAGVIVTIIAGAFTAFGDDIKTALATIAAAIPT